MNETFQVVKYKKRRKAKLVSEKHLKGCELVVEYVHIDTENLQTKISKAQQAFAGKPIISDLIDKVTENFKDFDELLCCGLGSFSDSAVSLHQLACLLALKDHFGAKTFAYDPVFTPCDKEALIGHGIEVLGQNDEGKTPISSTGNTLVYFPHVPSQLVNNFLWANWNPSLRNCVIISNSFSSVIDRHLNQPEGLGFIRRIIPICEEHPIKNTYFLNSVFNDLAVHSFIASDKVDTEFWNPSPEPNYEGSVVEYFEKDLVILMRKL